MIDITKIEDLIGTNLAPYLYNSKEFKPGKTDVFYSGPYWDECEAIAAVDTILNGRWVSSGERVRKFEEEFSKKFKVKFSTMVNSGSSANLVMITALKKYFKWKDDDEIIVSPVGFPTTISVIYQNRLKPVFIDIEWNTLNFDLDKIEEKITNKTKAIFVSPVLGNPPDMDRLVEICNRYDLHLVGDNCDSLGSKWNDKYLSEYYVAFSNSFYPAHHISTGEGGMVCTDNREISKIAKSITNWGRDCHCVGAVNLLADGSCGKRFSMWLPNYDGVIDHKYVFENMGYNLKPLDLQGAIGIEQLKKFDEIAERRKISKQTIENLFINNINGVVGVRTLPNADVCWFGTPFICETTELKRKLVQYLEDNIIQTRNYFAGNILLHGGFTFLDNSDNYPEANKVLDRVFFIGAAPHYNSNIFDYIETVVKKFKWN